MLIRWFSLLIVFLCVVPGISTVTGAEAEVPRCTRLLRLPEAVTLAELSNGLTVIVQENHVAPVATVRCFVKNTGSAYEGKRLGAPRVPIPYARPLEDQVRVTGAHIVAAARVLASA